MCAAIPRAWLTRRSFEGGRTPAIPNAFTAVRKKKTLLQVRDLQEGPCLVPADGPREEASQLVSSLARDVHFGRVSFIADGAAA